MDYSPPGSSVQGILQARMLKRVAIFFSRGCSQPRDQTCVFRVGRQILCCCCCLFSCFSHVLPCDPMDHSPPGSSVHGILQARYWSGLPCPPPGDLPNPTDSFLLVNNLCLIRHNSLRDSLHITYIPKESKRLAMLPIIRTLLVDHRYYKGTSLRGFQSKRSF